MPVYAVQHKTTKAYKLFLANDENVNQVANSIIQKASNPFFAIDNDVKNYNIGDIEDFDENVFNEMTNKSGEQYNELNDDEFCIDTNIYKCIELLNAKMKAKPKWKPDPKPAQKPSPKVSQDVVPTREIVQNDKSHKLRCECGQEVTINNLERHKTQNLMKQR